MQSNADTGAGAEGSRWRRKIGMMQRLGEVGSDRQRERGEARYMTREERRIERLRLSVGSYRDTLMVMSDEV